MFLLGDGWMGGGACRISIVFSPLYYADAKAWTSACREILCAAACREMLSPVQHACTGTFTGPEVANAGATGPEVVNDAGKLHNADFFPLQKVFGHVLK